MLFRLKYGENLSEIIYVPGSTNCCISPLSISLKYRSRSKPSVMGFYKVERIVAKRVQAGREEYFVHCKNYSSREHMGTGQPSARGTHHRLRRQVRGSDSRRWITRETHPSFWEGLEIARHLQRDNHNAPWCITIIVSWNAITSQWDSIPRQRRRIDDSRSWLFTEKVLNSHRWWLLRIFSCQP